LSVVATVLIPTHNHGRLLTYAARSVLEQSVGDIELFIVGDGVDDATREAAREAAALDSRVRFFDFPKGPRRGEIHRHAALREARGRIVCYLADDDLYLPRHVEAMAEGLREADFTHAVALTVNVDQTIEIFNGHLAHPAARERMKGLWNFIPLGNGAHTMELYRRLPFGWRTSPDDTWTDLYMWRQILGVEGVRAVSGRRTTVLHFPSPHRAGWTLARREDEMARWARRIRAPEFELEMMESALDFAIRARFESDLGVEYLSNQLKWSQRDADPKQPSTPS